MANKRKSARSSGSSRRSSAKKHYGRKKPVVHLVPAVLEAGGVLLPTFHGPNPGLNEYVSGKMKGESTAPLGDYIMNSVTNVKSDLIPMAELIIGGMALKWVGKKTGLGRIGTKEVKVL